MTSQTLALILAKMVPQCIDASLVTDEARARITQTYSAFVGGADWFVMSDGNEMRISSRGRGEFVIRAAQLVAVTDVAQVWAIPTSCSCGEKNASHRDASGYLRCKGRIS